jgi:hypothetical protein
MAAEEGAGDAAKGQLETHHWPPEDDEAPSPPESAWPELRALKAFGIAFATMAALAAVAPGLAPPSAADVAAPWLRLLNVALAASGAALSAAGMLAPRARRALTYAGPGLLVAAAAASPVRASLGAIPAGELLSAFLFAVCWLLTAEYMHALTRFAELGRYARRQRLTSFDLGGIVRHFVAYGLGLAALIVGVAAIAAVLVPWGIGRTANAVLANSAELGAVWGIALASAIVFGLSGLILTLMGSLAPPAERIERVAYSREQIQGMLAHSRVVGADGRSPGALDAKGAGAGGSGQEAKRTREPG